jgi:glycosyltransferase involved in cell wall biosynthesis
VDLSIVIPSFNEEDSLLPLHGAVSRVLDQLGLDSEIIFVNDGSSDGSPAILDRLASQEHRVRVIHLRRNYGQTAALMAGIQYSSGKVIVPMDGDGQNDPSDIPRLIDKMTEGYEVVSGWRKAREDVWLTRRLPSVIANWLISRIMGVNLHDYGCTLKAYRRDVIEDVRLYGEMHRFIPVYAAREGARVTELVVKHHPRRFGHSKYGMGRIARVTLDLLVLHFLSKAFDRPMQFFGKFGLGFIGLSILTIIFALCLRLFFGVSLIQTPLPLLAATTGLSGILFVLLGVMAEVQVRTYYEALGKTPFKVRSTRNFERIEPQTQRAPSVVDT